MLEYDCAHEAADKISNIAGFENPHPHGIELAHLWLDRDEGFKNRWVLDSAGVVELIQAYRVFATLSTEPNAQQ
jgi:hypothetical protein